jgi:branched-chain amino acid transport system permease protein
METFIQLTISGFLLGGVYSLMSVGLTLIFGVARIINFAHGEYLMLAMYASVGGSVFLGLNPYITMVPIAIGIFFAGIITYEVLLRKTITAPTNVQVFVTLGLSTALQGLALWLWKGDFRSIKPTPITSAVLYLGSFAVNLPSLVASIVAIISSISLILFLNYTFMGRAIKATVQDRQAASLMGVNIDKVYGFSFSLGISLAGVAGCLFSPIYPAYPTVGSDLILVAFVIVVLGGLGNLLGALLGGIVIGIVETWSGYYIATSMKQLVYFIIFISILILRPTGFFGQKGAQEVGFR